MGNHGDAGAIRAYAGKMRSTAKRLQTISDDADASVYFYTADWQGQFRENLLQLWNMNFTADDQLNSQAWANDRAAFVKANPHLARLYDANSSQNPSAFRQLIDGCNSFADSLDNYASYIDKANQADTTTFWVDIGIGAVVLIASVATAGLAAPELTVGGMLLAGAIGGATAMVMDGTNQVIDNMIINGDSFLGALGHMNLGELAVSFGVGAIVGIVTVLGGAGLSSVLTQGVSRVFGVAITNTFGRTAIAALSFGTAAALTDVGTQLVTDHFTGAQFDWGQVGIAAAFGAAGAGLHGLLKGGTVVPGTDTTITVTNPGEQFTAVVEPGTDGALSVFSGDKLVGPGVVSEDGMQILVTKPGGEQLSIPLANRVDVTNGIAGFKVEGGQLTQVWGTGNGTTEFTVLLDGKGVPAELAGPNGKMVVPEGWNITQSLPDGVTTITSPDGSRQFSGLLVAEQVGSGAPTGPQAMTLLSDGSVVPAGTADPNAVGVDGTRLGRWLTIGSGGGPNDPVTELLAGQAPPPVAVDPTVAGGGVSPLLVASGGGEPIPVVQDGTALGNATFGDGTVSAGGRTFSLGEISVPESGGRITGVTIAGDGGGLKLSILSNGDLAVGDRVKVPEGWTVDLGSDGSRVMVNPETGNSIDVNWLLGKDDGGPAVAPVAEPPTAPAGPNLDLPGGKGWEPPGWSTQAPAGSDRTFADVTNSGSFPPEAGGGAGLPPSDTPSTLRFAPNQGTDVAAEAQVEPQAGVLLADPPAETTTGLDISSQIIQDPFSGAVFTERGPVSDPGIAGLAGTGTSEVAPPVEIAAAPVDVSSGLIGRPSADVGPAFGVLPQQPGSAPSVAPVPAPVTLPLQMPLPRPPEVTLPRTWVTQPVPLRVPLPNAPEVTLPVPFEVPAPAPLEVPQPLGAPGPTPLRTQPVPLPGQPDSPPVVPTQPTPVPTQPTPVPTQPTPVPTQPTPVPTQPTPVPTQPTPAPTQPAPVPTRPAPLPGLPQAPGAPGLPGTGLPGRPQVPGTPPRIPAPGPLPQPAPAPVPIPGLVPGTPPVPELTPPSTWVASPPPEEFPLRRPNEFPVPGAPPEIAVDPGASEAPAPPVPFTPIASAAPPISAPAPEAPPAQAPVEAGHERDAPAAAVADAPGDEHARPQGSRGSQRPQGAVPSTAPTTPPPADLEVRTPRELLEKLAAILEWLTGNPSAITEGTVKDSVTGQGGYLNGKFWLSREAMQAITTAAYSKIYAAKLGPADRSAFLDAVLTAIHEGIHSVSRPGASQEPAPGEEDPYNRPAGKNLEEGLTESLAQALLADFVKASGLLDLSGLTLKQFLAAKMTFNPYAAQKELVEQFARQGGAALLGFPDEASMLKALAMETSVSRFDAMAEAIIEAQALPGTPPVRQQLVDAIEQAFEGDTHEPLALNSDPRVGADLADSALAALRAAVDQIRSGAGPSAKPSTDAGPAAGEERQRPKGTQPITLVNRQAGPRIQVVEGPVAPAAAARIAAAPEPQGPSLRIAMLPTLGMPLPPVLYGGNARVINDLTEELVRRGHEVTLFAAEDSGTSARLHPVVPHAFTEMDMGPEAPKTVLMGDRMEIARTHYYLRQLLAAEKMAEQFDAIHVHLYTQWLLHGARLPTPIVMTLHNELDTPEARAMLQRFRGINLVSISNDQRGPVADLDLAWAGTVYHGLDLRSRYQLGGGAGGYLAFLGRLAPDKDPVRAIDVAIRAGMPLRMIGGVGPRDRQYFEERVRPLLDHPLIHWEGETDDAGKNEILGGASALIAPTAFREPFGLVYIEAGAVGTPVVSRPIGSLPEIVVPGMSGFLADDTDEMVEAVQAAGELDRAAIRRHTLEHYSVETMASGYEAVYRGLRGEGPAGGAPPVLAPAPPPAPLEVREPAPAGTPEEQPNARPLRIAMLAPLGIPIPPQRYGGAGRVVAELTDELVRRGHEVTLFGPGDAQTLARLLAVAPRPVTEMDLEELFTNPVLMGSRFDAAAGHYWTHQLLELEKLQDEFDVVHAHHYAHWLVAPRLEVHMLATLHNVLTHPQARGMLERFAGLPLVSISDDQRNPVADLDLNWAATVHNGLDLASRYELGSGDGGYLAFLGRLSPDKDPLTAIEVAIRAGIPLKIAARVGGADQEFFDQQVRPRLRHPLIEWVGEQDDRGKNELLGGARALLAPTTFREPFGLVYIESLATGTPVISRPRGSLPEIVRQGVDGFLTEDVGEMVRAVEASGDLDRAEARQGALDRFSVEKMADGYEAAYRGLIGQEGIAPQARPASTVPGEAAAPSRPQPPERSGSHVSKAAAADHVASGLDPAAAVVRELVSGPVPAASGRVLEQVRAADQALSDLGPDPLSRERAEQALAGLQAAIEAADGTAALLDLAGRQLRAEVARARALPAEQRPAGLPEAEALASPAVQEALEAVLRDAREVVAAGRLRLGASQAPAPPGLRLGPLPTGRPDLPIRSQPRAPGTRTVQAERARRIGATGEPELVPLTLPETTAAGQRIRAAEVVATPAIGEEEFAAAAAHRLDVIRQAVRGAEGDALSRVEEQALKVAWRFEETRRVTDPLAGTATQAARRQVPRELGVAVIDAATRIVDAFNDPTLTGEARQERIRAEIAGVRERVSGTPLADAIDFAGIEAAVAALRGTTSAGLPLLDGAGELTVDGQPAGTLLGLLQDVLTANRTNHRNGIDVEYLVNLDAPSVGGRSEVQVIARPRAYSVSPEGVPSARLPELPAGVGGRFVVEIGAGSGSFAVDMVPASEQAAAILVQTELGEFAFRAQMRRDQQFGLRNVSPRGGERSVVVLGDALQHLELFFGTPGAGGGVRRVIINNINAHYTPEQYDALARELRAALAEGGQVEVQWDDSPEDAAGTSRGHIEADALRDALERAGVDVDHWREPAIPYPYDVTPPGGARPGREVPPPPDPTSPTGGRGVIRRRGAQAK